jgi:salicylate hydroxylase
LPPRAIIAGAGIGGLAAAIALSQAGFKVAIYERTDKLEEFGAGLQITPNATRVLARLGLLERVRQLSSKPPAVLVLRGSDNAKLMRLPLDDAERRWGAEYLVIHRADLQTALVEAVRARPGIELSLGTTVTGFAANGDTISVRLQRGLTAARDEADLLIGADGLRSQVRSGLGFGPADRADFTRRVAYRALVNAEDVEPRWARSEIVLRLGPEAHLVQYPLRRGLIINLVATIRSPSRAGGGDQQWDGAADRSTLERAFAGWSKEARALTAVRQFLLSRSGARRWSAMRLIRWSHSSHRARLRRSRMRARWDARSPKRRTSPPPSRFIRAIAWREPLGFNAKRSDRAASIIWGAPWRSLATRR